MRSRQSVLLDTARHVQVFLDENAALIGPTIASSRRNLDDAVAQLTAMAVTQSGGTIASKGATARQRSLRTSLRNNFMRPIATVAKLKLVDVPEFHALTMPAKPLGSTQLVAAAHAMADAAELHAAVFAEVGLPGDFFAQLRAAADAVTTSLDARQKHSGHASGATAGLKAQEARVRNLFKLINALLIPKLGTNVILLAKWKMTKAVSHKVPVVPTPATPPATTSTPPSTTTTATPSATPVTSGSTTPPAPSTTTTPQATPAA